jgi:flagellar biosynthesis anti-sigma factor FlgM
MNTKIDGIGGSTGSLRLEPQARRVGGGAAEPVGAVSASGALRLDDDSLQLSAGATAAAGQGFDGARVEQLRADIEAGRYTINTQTLAARLLEIEGSL